MINEEKLIEWLSDAKEKALLQSQQKSRAGNSKMANQHFGRAWAFTEVDMQIGLLLNHAPEASAETPAVRQNEQTQTVLPHQLVLIKGKKDWFCWFCKKYEHELIGKTGGCARRAGL